MKNKSTTRRLTKKLTRKLTRRSLPSRKPVRVKPVQQKKAIEMNEYFIPKLTHYSDII